MLTITNQKHYDETVAFAKSVGKWEGQNGLKTNLDRLEAFIRDPAVQEVRLFKDFAPHSFEWQLERKTADGKEIVFNGGLIFHGSHDGGGNGGAPTFSVSLTSCDGWAIHT